MAEDVFNQKDRDQDIALLSLERSVARIEEWKINHKDVHEVESIQRDLLRQSMNSRLEGMNEFRQSLKDTQDKAISRELFDGKHDALADRVGRLEALLPLIAVLSAAISAAITASLLKAFGG